MNEELLINEAKSTVKKYRIITLVSMLVWVIACVAIYLMFYKAYPIPTLLVCFALILLMRRFLDYVFIRIYTRPLFEDLNAPLFLEMVKRSMSADRSASWLIQGEFFSGHYGNVIGLCQKKLGEKRVKKSSKYYYLSYLAATYFDIGDEEKLSEVLSAFENEFQKESRGRQKKLRQTYRSMEFYKSFINRDFESCEGFLNIPVKFPIQGIRNIYFNARIAFEKGENEKARELFEKVISKAPDLNYAEASRRGIESIENCTDYKDEFSDISVNEDVAIPCPTIWQKIVYTTATVMKWICIAFLSFLLCLWCLIGIFDLIDLPDRDQTPKTFEELIADDYESIEIIDRCEIFIEEEFVDNIYICKDDSSIILFGCYFDKNLNNNYYVEIMKNPIRKYVLTKDFSYEYSFVCHASANTVEVIFCSSIDKVPAKYVHLTEVDIKGKTVYIVIEEIKKYTGAMRIMENLDYYIEEIKIDYPDAELLDHFDLYYEGKYIECLSLCKTEDNILLGGHYTKIGSDHIYFDVIWEKPISDLKKDSYYYYCTDEVCRTGPYKWRVSIQSEIMFDNLYYFEMDIDGKKCYFYLEEIIPWSN